MGIAEAVSLRSHDSETKVGGVKYNSMILKEKTKRELGVDIDLLSANDKTKIYIECLVCHKPFLKSFKDSQRKNATCGEICRKNRKQHNAAMREDLNTIISKEILEPLANKKNKDIVAITGYSLHIVKKSLAHHGLYSGKTYTINCPTCLQDFTSYSSGSIYCSNNCKFQKQKIWNRGLTKENNQILKTASEKMIGNTIGDFRKAEEASMEIITLPFSGITIGYDKKSSLEKEWLLQVEKIPGFKNVIRSAMCITYDGDFKDGKYYPDFEVEWETGPKWLVEIKGILTDQSYSKFSSAANWCTNNGYQYRLITTGQIKTNSWNTVYLHPKNVIRPSPEWALMNHAVTWALLSPSPRNGVGAVIASKDYRHFLSYGYNGDENGGSNIATSLLPGADGFIHAEENALIKLSSREESVMFVTTSPCLACAKKIITHGSIKEVYYLRQYRDMSGIGLLVQNGIKVYHFLLTNHLGNAFIDDEAFRALSPAMCHVDDDILWRFNSSPKEYK